ncbi:MAG: cytochrome c maturation protein CcmE [Bacteroidetes bacterium]|nr:MAG: cytochrome c maturation protein CcmE [Bacteroidota bacterium]
MKPRFIIMIVLIGVAIAAIVSMYGSSSEYVTFETASANPDREFHVIGELVKDSAMQYDPIKDPNHLVFYLKDSVNAVARIVFHSPKPADLERSEKIVIVGKMNEGSFKASSILLKCPSKYNEGVIEETRHEAKES